ncbi:MAG: hypothetical protein QXH42_07005 [Thermoplasmata archaeon]
MTSCLDERIRIMSWRRRFENSFLNIPDFPDFGDEAREWGIVF